MNAKDTLKRLISDVNVRIVILLVAIAISYAYLFLPVPAPLAPEKLREACNSTFDVHFFYLPSCPHCKAQIPLNQELAREFPCAVWVYHDLDEPGTMPQLLELRPEFWNESTRTPTTIIGNETFIGFDEQETPARLRAVLSANSRN